MCAKITRNNIGYGLDNALQGLAPRPIVSKRAPLTTDSAEIGTTWVDTATQAVYVLAAISAGSAIWTTSPAAGSGTFTSVTVNPGNLLVSAGNATISAGNLAVTAGNVTVGGNLTVTGTSQFNGTIDFSSTALIDLDTTSNTNPAIRLKTNGGTTETIVLNNIQGTSATAINLLASAGGIQLYAPVSTSTSSINLQSDAGGITVSALKAINVTSTAAGASAVVIAATNGGVDVTSGGAAIDINIASTGGSVNISGTEAAADAVAISASAGGMTITSGGAASDITVTATGGSINLIATEAAADAVVINASNAASGMTVAVGTAGMATTATGGAITFATTKNAANAIDISANGGTSETIRLHALQGTGTSSINIISDVGGVAITSTGLASANAVTLNASNAAGGITSTAGTGGITNTTTGVFTVTSTDNAAACINLNANGGTSETVRLHSTQGTAISSINLLSDVGGIALTATGLANADAIKLNAAAGGVHLAGVLQTKIETSQAAAGAILINATNAAGGIQLTTGGGAIALSSAGLLTAVPTTDTQASATSTTVQNSNLGSCTFTGFTTASGASQLWTVTNSLVTTASKIFVSVSNEGTNDAQMTITQVKRAAGSFTVNTKNNGAAALNGNVTLNFWVFA